MEELHKQKSSNTTGIAEMRYSLFDLSLENAEKQKGFQHQMGVYRSLMQGLQGSLSQTKQEQIETEYDTAQRTLAEKQRLYHSSLDSGDEVRTAALKEEIESAEKRIAQSQAAYNELQANLSDRRKVQEKMDALAEEQNKRHAESQSNLWNFQFDNASTSKQQQMARSAFFEAQNRFEGARSDDERDKALQDMQSMYGKIDTRAAEMPPWNGFLHTTSDAVESRNAKSRRYYCPKTRVHFGYRYGTRYHKK
jgi:chromosome segregation ATPase